MSRPREADEGAVKTVKMLWWHRVTAKCAAGLWRRGARRSARPGARSPYIRTVPRQRRGSKRASGIIRSPDLRKSPDGLLRIAANRARMVCIMSGFRRFVPNADAPGKRLGAVKAGGRILTNLPREIHLELRGRNSK